MSNIKKYWLPITIGIIGAYYIYKSLKKPESVLKPDGRVVTGNQDNITSNVNSNQGAGTSSFPVKKGDKGDLVIAIQTAIGAKNLPKYGIDGDFGNETLAAVKAALGKSTVDSQADIDRLTRAYASVESVYGKPVDYNTPIPQKSLGGIMTQADLTQVKF
jgi:hypothetical protein